MKNILFYFVGVLLLWLVIWNFRIVTDPSEELARTVASDWYWDWKVDLLLWRGADPNYKDGQVYEAMLMFKHYGLIERFGNRIPDDKTQEMYVLSKKYVTSKEIDERLRKSLRIKDK